jgi:hypothetical protein
VAWVFPGTSAIVSTTCPVYSKVGQLAGSDAPVGIDPARHRELSGRDHRVWWRRAVLLVVAAVPVLGLLNVFGQHAEPRNYFGPAASLLIDSPARVRGGLTFTTEIVITPHQQMNDARLYLDNGWFEAMTYNGAAPQPSSETASARPWYLQVTDRPDAHGDAKCDVA